MVCVSLPFPWVQDHHLLSLVLENLSPFVFHSHVQPHELELSTPVNLSIEFRVQGFKGCNQVSSWLLFCQQNNTEGAISA